MDNRSVARHLLAWAHSLEADRANLYRVKAYRRAAETIMGLDRPVEDLVAGEGRKGLKQLPGIGGRLSEKIEKLVRTPDIATLTEDHSQMVQAPG
jgi:DNA polymerase (family 10)